MTAAYPLHWPEGRPRTAPGARKFASFNQKKNNGRYLQTIALSVAAAFERLQKEVDALGAQNTVLSTNIELRLDGRPRSDKGNPVDPPPPALWFTLRGQDIVLACDRWTSAADNIAAIAKHIEAMRGMERWGVGTLDQAFTGYVALPPQQATRPALRPWWQVLVLHPSATRSEILRAHRELIRKYHPDTGGSEHAASEINQARDEALRELSDHG
ncbi:J domain-containing protein [Novosphingobium sp. FSW06-99]|uniref:J domain-containing protein n=1 Tax=Novosphingobium sp. FSW06-99 TaxID=1739113 RepID=UPI00076D2862|nr:J domain-containing protein [Novosphingobium sp. FSW06-99]KUR80791.1 hypothetical protein AQZ49_01820 [Novosphingobium sp. FSW06-99]